jgi:hypothetical protein
MAKWRVADVMGKGGGLNNGGHMIGFNSVGQVAFFGQLMADHKSHGPCNTGYFKAMGQAGMDIVVFRQRMNLRLALQTPESRRKNDPVVILVKIGSTERADT